MLQSYRMHRLQTQRLQIVFNKGEHTHMTKKQNTVAEECGMGQILTSYSHTLACFSTWAVGWQCYQTTTR